MALQFAIAVALLNHAMLYGLWKVRHDGQAGVCWPCFGCGLIVLTPASLILLLVSVPPSPERTQALLFGLSVFIDVGALVLWGFREVRRERAREEAKQERAEDA